MLSVSRTRICLCLGTRVEGVTGGLTRPALTCRLPVGTNGGGLSVFLSPFPSDETCFAVRESHFKNKVKLLRVPVGGYNVCRSEGTLCTGQRVH